MRFPSPIGSLHLESRDGALRQVERRNGAAKDRPDPGSAAAAAQLEEYFAGRRRRFDLPLAPAGTPFQQKVWAALRRIPFGETRSYAEIAREVGSSARAVGGACGANPILLVIPCHRVVAADGGLGGFSAGLKNKEWLLAFERAALARPGKTG